MRKENLKGFLKPTWKKVLILILIFLIFGYLKLHLYVYYSMHTYTESEERYCENDEDCVLDEYGGRSCCVAVCNNVNAVNKKTSEILKVKRAINCIIPSDCLQAECEREAYYPKKAVCVDNQCRVKENLNCEELKENIWKTMCYKKNAQLE